MTMTLTKSGITLGIIAEHNFNQVGKAKLLTVCDCTECKKEPRMMRYRLLPCRCHGTLVECNCKVHDKKCNTCGRVYVQMPPYIAHGERFVDWYQVEDPHGENAKL